MLSKQVFIPYLLDFKHVERRQLAFFTQVAYLRFVLEECRQFPGLGEAEIPRQVGVERLRRWSTFAFGHRERIVIGGQRRTLQLQAVTVLGVAVFRSDQSVRCERRHHVFTDVLVHGVLSDSFDGPASGGGFSHLAMSCPYTLANVESIRRLRITTSDDHRHPSLSGPDRARRHRAV